MTRLFLARHGETEWNVQRRIQGQTDTTLNDRGLEQAARLAQRLEGYSFDAVYASDLKRAWDTATIAMKGRDVEVTAEPRLRETHFGIFEGHTLPELEQKYPAETKLWYKDRNNAPEGGETRDQFAARMQALLDDLHTNHHDDTVLLVSHGGSISMIAALLIGLETQLRWQFRVENASLSIMERNAQGNFMILWNDIHHLHDLIDAGWYVK